MMMYPKLLVCSYCTRMALLSAIILGYIENSCLIVNVKNGVYKISTCEYKISVCVCIRLLVDYF